MAEKLLEDDDFLGMKYRRRGRVKLTNIVSLKNNQSMHVQKSYRSIYASTRD